MKIEIEVPDETIRDLLITAAEGGSNYWVARIRAERATGTSSFDVQFYDVPLQGGAWLVLERDEDVPKRLDLASIKRAFELWPDKAPRTFGIFMRERGGSDADVADTFLQLATLGEVVYG